jgi:hypothetical protein
MQGLALARRSIGKLAAEDPERWRGPTDFQVVRPGAVPEVLLPAHIYPEEATFLDTLARHRPAAIVSACDPTNTWTARLGPPVLCIGTLWTPRDLAAQLLRLWQNRTTMATATTTDEDDDHDDAEESSRGGAAATTLRTKGWDVLQSTTEQQQEDGLRWIVQTVEQLALLKQQRGDQWRDERDMRRSVFEHFDMEEVHYDEPSRLEAAGPFFVAVAWLIFVLSVSYVPLKQIVPAGRGSATRRHHHHRGSGDGEAITAAAVMDEFVNRLPELEHMWQLWIASFKEHLSRWDHSAETTSESRQGEPYQPRRKRTAKKRH